METLSDRHIDLIKNLLASNTPIDIRFFVKKYNKSERTIYNDLNKIREVFKDKDIQLRNSNKQGLYIPASHKDEVMKLLSTVKQNDSAMEILDQEDGRNRNIILYLLFKKSPIGADEIANRLYVSRSTILRNLHEINLISGEAFSIVGKYSKGYVLKGDEFEIRKVASKIIQEFFMESFSEEDWYVLLPSILKDQISLHDITYISSAIKKINLMYDVWISNSAFLDLLVYCLIRRIRIHNGIHFQYLNHVQKKVLDSVESSYVHDLISELDEDTVFLCESEVAYLLELLAENGIFMRADDHQTNIKLNYAIEEMLKTLKRETHKSFDFVSLQNDLYQHILHFLNRNSDSMEDVSEILNQVRNEYLDFHRVSVSMAEKFNEIYGLTLSENEISYITIYLVKNSINYAVLPKRILIVCATGKGLSNLLATRIRNAFPALNVVDSVSVYQVENFDFGTQIDFIVSTIPIKASKYPVIKVSSILSLQDINRIQEFLHYGKLIDKIPFSSKNLASISSKNKNPFDLPEMKDNIDGQSIESSSAAITKLIMTLLEYVTIFPVEYQMDQDRILGMMIHLIMAIPRWFHGMTVGDDVVHAYKDIEKNHPKIVGIMDNYFRVAEDTLLVTIPIPERYAFYLYILREE